MKELEKRYGKALAKINAKCELWKLPEEVQKILKNTTDLETKTKMLEAIAERIGK